MLQYMCALSDNNGPVYNVCICDVALGPLAGLFIINEIII